MGKIETDNLISVSELSALRTILNAKSATDQAIRNQVKAIEDGKLTTKDAGFDVERVSQKDFYLRINNIAIEKFRLKHAEWVEKNKPK